MELRGLDGLITEETGEVLYKLASSMPADQYIVEIGSFKGKSTCYLAAGAREGAGAKVAAVDPWDSNGNIQGKHNFNSPTVWKTFLAQIYGMGLDDLIEPQKGLSKDVADRWAWPVGLLFIDGDHQEESVLGDFFAWKPHLAEFATVVFDDYKTRINPGVAQAVKHLIEHGSVTDLHTPVPTLAVTTYCD